MQAPRAPRWVIVVYTALAVLLVAYCLSLIIRQPDQSNPLVDGWGVAAFEVLTSALCIWRAIGSRRRIVPLMLGLGILSWSIGDTILAAESAGGATVPVPSLADLFWLAFYPVTYVALVVLTRKHLARVGATTWLDGGVAGLGAAALCACFAFNTILHSVGGDATTVATDLAYPIGDALLLILAVGGTAIIPGRKNPQWLLIASAIGCTAIGDTFNLFASSGSPSHIGVILDGVAWPCRDPPDLLRGLGSSHAHQSPGAQWCSGVSAAWPRRRRRPLHPSGGYLPPGLSGCYWSRHGHLDHRRRAPGALRSESANS